MWNEEAGGAVLPVIEIYIPIMVKGRGYRVTRNILVRPLT